MRMERIRPVDAGTLLVRALRLHASAAGCPIHVESLGVRPWASATFTGTRHRVVLSAVPSPALAAWIAALAEAELALCGHLVADVAIDDDATTDDVRRIALAVLTLVAT